MPADAYVMDEDMKKVADAIRTKSKKTGSIVFPDGFVNEINGLGGVAVKVARLGRQEVGKPPEVGCDIVMDSYINPAVNFDVIPNKWGSTPGRYDLTVGINGITDSVAVDVKKPPIYGVKIEQSNSSPNGAVEYIDDAVGFTPMTRNSPGSWKDNPLIAGIKPVLRKSDGTWQDLNKRNLASGADITTLGNDVFTEIPTWYLSITSSGNTSYIRFSQEKRDNTYFDLASFYNGSRKKMFHIGCYHAYNSGNKLYSSANKTPTGSISFDNCWRYAQARGTGFDQIGYYQWMYIQALFLLLFKGRDGKTILGQGYISASSITVENITTYDNDYGMAGSTSATEQMSFFWINNLWDNIMTSVGGAKLDGNQKLMTLDQGQPINANGSGWVVQSNSPASGGWISVMDMKSTKSGFLPIVSKGRANTHWCNFSNNFASQFYSSGGAYGNGVYTGLFRSAYTSKVSDTDSKRGTRLVYREGRAYA